jgi:hypothetical protein
MIRRASAFTSGDLRIERSVSNMWQQGENIRDIDARQMREMMGYVSRAFAVSR